jgi:photosystem II stability/assembly factor-like uncharacterized protein
LIRLVATAAALAMALALPAVATADTAPDATWVMLGALPERLDGPVFALAVDPANPQVVLAGTSRGSIYRSTDGGGTWNQVRRDLGRGVLALAFNPFKPGQVLAGARGGGIWRSSDGGLSWSAQAGSERASVRSFGFARTVVAAGTDRGILASRQDGQWAPAGLDQLSVAAVAPVVVNDPPRLLAGGDASRGSEALPLYQSPDGGGTWSLLPGPASGSTMVAVLAAGPLPPSKEIRPVIMGTNTGLFVSIDNGASWQQLNGGGSLPNTDFSQVAYAPGRWDRFYVASDGGASDRGGLWTTTDGGQRFVSLNTPVPSVTALAVASDGDVPIVYAASFRPADHAVLVWRLRDTGRPVNGPAVPLPGLSTSVAAPNRSGKQPQPLLQALMTGPEGPYLAISAMAVGLVVLALFAYFRRGRG